MKRGLCTIYIFIYSCAIQLEDMSQRREGREGGGWGGVGEGHRLMWFDVVWCDVVWFDVV